MSAMRRFISISRRIMKDSQPVGGVFDSVVKYIKANNERFSTNIHNMLHKG